MRLVTLTNLYPNEVQIRHGVFVRERLKNFLAMTQLTNVSPVVIAPIPWFPLNLRKSLAKLVDVESEVCDKELGCTVYHPRYVALPLIGNFVSPVFYALSSLSILRRLQEDRQDLIIDAHFGFPDSVAAVMLGKVLKVPVVTTLRGSDLNQMAQEIGIRQWIKWALNGANFVITVSAALRQKVCELIPGATHLEVVRNGVDGTVFSIASESDRSHLRAQLGLTNPTLLSVGNLLPLKGHDLVIDALQQLPTFDLMIVGGGPQAEFLRNRATSQGLGDRVKFIGEIPQQNLVKYYQVADALVLASSREGLPNVVLEALSCGTPVIATDVGGVSEILKQPVQGTLLGDRAVDAIVDAVRELDFTDQHGSREKIRESVAEFDWKRTVTQLDTIFKTLPPSMDQL